LPVLQLERKLEDINSYVHTKLGAEMEADFGINLKRLDIAAVEFDKTSPHYLQLKSATVDQQTKFIDAKTVVEITNLGEMARIQRKETEMGVEGRNFAVHQINTQADVLRTAAENLGAMGNVDLGDGGCGFSPIGIMTGMAVGGAMGRQMGGMMGTVADTPPPPPANTYHIAINGQQSGPFTVDQLKEYALTGSFTKAHFVWKAGMAAWESAESVPALQQVFEQVPPPPPPPNV